ncbi:MAG: hypothetical protein IT258_19070 [Saprospiraceae bacterium]|nr:hypothetical protein [Saprospiraceae bacterium]
MRPTTTKILSALVLAATLLACNGNGAKTDEATTEATTDTTAATAATETPAVQTVNAKFVEFTLGDAEHYSFEDKAGKTYDFGGCEDKSVEFGVQVPEGEANETNQGWGSNKALQGKWFDLKYIVRKQPLYQDGPEGDVQVITEAKMVQ